MNGSYVLLVEKEAMWAAMLMQVLGDNGIPYTALPVHGAGLTLKTGIPERLRLYVPADSRTAAEALLQALFSGEAEA